MTLYILAHLDADDAQPYLEQISKSRKSAVFKAMLLSFRVSHNDLIEHFEAIEWKDMPGWEKYEEIGYILTWNTKLGELVFGQKG